MKYSKITLLCAFFAFDCFGMQADDGDAHNARSRSVNERFTGVINENHLPAGGLLFPVIGNGEPVEATPEEQTKIENDIGEYLSLRDAENDNPLIIAAIEEAIRDDDKAGIWNTIELLEKLTDAIISTSTPVLVTVDSFFAFCEKAGCVSDDQPGRRTVLGICARLFIAREDENYISFLAICIDPRGGITGLALPENGGYKIVSYPKGDVFYHESFHANAILRRYSSHLMDPSTGKKRVSDLQYIAARLNVPLGFFSDGWTDDAELHCIAGIYLTPKGMQLDPLCENARLLKIKGGIRTMCRSICCPEKEPVIGELAQLYKDKGFVIWSNGEFLKLFEESDSLMILYLMNFSYSYVFPRLGYKGLSIPTAPDEVHQALIATLLGELL
jgi:hypothetical protein